MAKIAIGRTEIEALREEYEGRRLERAMAFLGMNQEQFADLLGIDRARLSRWFSGKEPIQGWRIAQCRKAKLAYTVAQWEKQPGASFKYEFHGPKHVVVYLEIEAKCEQEEVA